MHRDHGPLLSLTLALTTSRPTDHACLHRGDRLIWVLLPVEPFDLCRLEESHVTAAAAPFALAAHPPVFAYATAAAVLALAALPPVLAEVSASALLAHPTSPPVLADVDTAAVLALRTLPPVLAYADTAALLANAALSTMRAHHRATPRVRTGGRRRAVRRGRGFRQNSGPQIMRKQAGRRRWSSAGIAGAPFFDTP